MAAEAETTTQRITSQGSAAQFFSVSPKTIASWLGAGYITGYQYGRGVLVDIDEIEAAFETNKHMRDGRRSRYGANARIVPLPTQRAEVAE